MESRPPPMRSSENARSVWFTMSGEENSASSSIETRIAPLAIAGAEISLHDVAARLVETVSRRDRRKCPSESSRSCHPWSRPSMTRNLDRASRLRDSGADRLVQTPLGDFFVTMRTVDVESLRLAVAGTQGTTDRATTFKASSPPRSWIRKRFMFLVLNAASMRIDPPPARGRCSRRCCTRSTFVNPVDSRTAAKRSSVVQKTGGPNFGTRC